MISHSEMPESVTSEKQSVTIPRWFDRHLHIRDTYMMEDVLPCTLKQKATGAVIMPNPSLSGPPGPIDTVEKALAYRRRIAALLPKGSDFIPCMTLYLTDHTTPEEVVCGFEEGVIRAVKLYMANQKGEGGTTGSGHGVRDLVGRYPVFKAMQEISGRLNKPFPLLGHWEAVEEDVDEFDREIFSVNRDLMPILKSFPGLTVVFEHLTDGRAAEFVADSDHPGGLYATVTVQHLIINRNAMFWGGMNPINYCKPVPKRESHRLKVRKYVTSGNRRFGAGTDSAPHDMSTKSLCCGCAAGTFTAPRAVEMYTTVFDEDNALQHLGQFLSENFVNIYGMEVSQKVMTIQRASSEIPKKVGDVMVFEGGKTIPWTLM